MVRNVHASRDSAHFEVVVNIEDTEEDAGDVAAMLPYPLADAKSDNPFDEMAAGETLILLSESGESSSQQGLISG